VKGKRARKGEEEGKERRDGKGSTGLGIGAQSTLGVTTFLSEKYV